MVMKIIYLVATFISLFELIIFYETSPLNLNKNFLLLYVTTLISNFGYSLLVFTTTLEAALIGNVFSYFGSICTIFFMFYVIIEMCGKKMPLPLGFLLFGYSIAVTVMVATTEMNHFFYKEVALSKLYGLTIIKTKNGPGMFLYLAYLAIINISAIIIILVTLLQRKKASKRVLFSLLGMIVFGTLAYVIPVSFGVKFNLMPFTYIILQTYFLRFAFKANSYDLVANLMNVYKQRGGYGYIAFDHKKRLLGYDDFATEVFPQLKEIRLDSMIPDICTSMIEKLHYNDENWNWNENCNKDFKILNQDKAFICTIHPMTSRMKRTGFLLELRDDTEQQNYIKSISDFNKELSRMVREKTSQVTSMQESIIRGMAIMVESRDNSTGGHVARTSDSIRIFAQELLKHKNEIPEITQEFCDLLIKAAPMHDLGKIAVDDSILRKPGRYEPEEYEKMKIHAEKGAVIVQEVLRESTDKDFERIAENVAHYHHERWNGEGYPDHLKGEEIPLEARIMALADVFDALVSQRCYKNAMDFDEAFELIQQDLGKHFDPIIGKLFILCRPQIEKYYNSVNK
ncbi:MAG: HD domain-containing protein [Treponema sp.]|nr:HD domain-containing protein [Treponema sp.]